MSAYVPRADQARTIAALRAAAADHRAILCVGPTGFGKSVLIALIAATHVALGGKVLVVVHRLELVSQLSAKLKAMDLQVGEIHPGATPFPAPVQVASLQTLLSRETLPPATMLIWDEAHHLLAMEWSRLWRSYPDALLLGFTATPMLADGTGLGAAFTALVPASTKAELRESGVLVPCEVLSPDDALHPGELAQDPVGAILQHAPGEQGVIFAPSVQVATQYACSLRAEGVPTGVVWGDMPAAQRRDTLAAYERGEVRVLTNVAILTEGWDCPPTSFIAIARRVGHLGLYDQMVGRGMRSSPGKTRCLLLDLVGATHMHGPPDEERRYSLDGRGMKRAQDAPDVRFCPVCGSPVVEPPCFECGHEGELRQRRPRVLGLPLTRFERKRREDDEARALTLSRWLAAAKAKGHREGSALHRYKAVYGQFPSRQLTARARSLT